MLQYALVMSQQALNLNVINVIVAFLNFKNWTDCPQGELQYSSKHDAIQDLLYIGKSFVGNHRFILGLL